MVHRTACALSWTVFALGFQATPTISDSIHASEPARASDERFWLAGRYDGNRVIIYFDAVKFNGTVPKNAARLHPVAEPFFTPVRLSASFIAHYQKKPHMEHFSIGDSYDLMLEGGLTTTVSLTSFVGFENDEQVGNDSYIGALASVNNADVLLGTRKCYAVRRHEEPARNSREKYQQRAGIDPDPLPFDVQRQIAAVLTERMNASGDAPPLSNDVAPRFTATRFTLADGSPRYYVRAEWRTNQERDRSPAYGFAAWMSVLPQLRILATERIRAPYGFKSEFPVILNVVDLAGRTGLIVSVGGLDSSELRLVEYKDGADVDGMHVFQSIGVGE